MDNPNTSPVASSRSIADAPSARRHGCAGSGGVRADRSPARASMRRPSDVEVGDLQRVVLDELAPRFDDIAHQGREDLVGGDRVLDPHLQQAARVGIRSEEHTSELQSLMRISYAVFCLKKKTRQDDK